MWPEQATDLRRYCGILMPHTATFDRPGITFISNALERGKGGWLLKHNF
jgi:hypothetical protein